MSCLVGEVFYMSHSLIVDQKSHEYFYFDALLISPKIIEGTVCNFNVAKITHLSCCYLKNATLLFLTNLIL